MKNIFLFSISFFLFFNTFLFAYDPYPEYVKNLEKKYEKVNDFNFWIKKIKNPDKIILIKKEIEQINKTIQELPESTINIAQEFDEKSVLNKIFATFNWLFRKNKFFYLTGKKITDKDKNLLINQMNLSEITETLNKNLFAVTTGHAYIKALPTDRIITKFNLVKYFDRNRETVLHLNEIVKILNISKDRKWYYIASQYSFGWVRTESLGIIKNIEQFENINKTFVVIVKNYKNLKLGDILPYKSGKILIPEKIKDSLHYKPINLPYGTYNIGFLPLTKRNILKLIFRTLKSDYNWGGSEKNWDCSLFVMDIFRCFGFILPRNSKKQSEIPTSITIDKITNKENFIIENGNPLLTFLYLPGHIMLYVGSNNGTVYIAHDFTFLNYHRGKLLITDLDFGRKGFEKRIKKIIILSK